METDSDPADRVMLERLGARLRAHRIARQLTQRALADEAGVALRTLQRLESGATATQLSHFLRVLRVLGLTDRIDTLIPEPRPSPIAELRLRGASPERVRAVRERPLHGSASKSRTQGAREWTWADDT